MPNERCVARRCRAIATGRRQVTWTGALMALALTLSGTGSGPSATARSEDQAARGATARTSAQEAVAARLRRRRVPRDVRQSVPTWVAGDGGCYPAPGKDPGITFWGRFATDDPNPNESHPTLLQNTWMTVCMSHFKETGKDVRVTVTAPDGTRKKRKARPSAETGFFTADVFLTPRLPPGTYRVQARQGAATAEAAFDVTRATHRLVSINRQVARRGDRVSIFLTNFAPNRRQRLLFYYSRRPTSPRRAHFLTWTRVRLDEHGDGAFTFSVSRAERPGGYWAVDRVPFIRGVGRALNGVAPLVIRRRAG